MLAIGQAAPAFSLPDQNGTIIKASAKIKAADNPQQMLDILLEN